MTEVRFSGLSSLSFLDGRGTCSKELYTEPQFSFGGFCTIARQFDFQQHSQKNQRAFSVSCPETNLQKRTAAESFFGRKSSIQFYFIISQARSTAACTDHDLLLNPPS